jgi:hypothetical protein
MTDAGFPAIGALALLVFSAGALFALSLARRRDGTPMPSGALGRAFAALGAVSALLILAAVLVGLFSRG